MTEIIQGIENLKNQYRKAKVMAGDYRGIKNRFKIAEDNGMNATKILFESLGGMKGRIGQDIGLVEVITEVYENEDSVGDTFYRMADFLKDIKTYAGQVRIVFTCNEWNKTGTDRDTKDLFEIEYIN
jgi:hypothetical protein